MSKKLEYIWLSRDKTDPGNGYVEAWQCEPTFSMKPRTLGEFVGTGHLLETEYANARRIFGVTLRPGQCKKIRIEVTE